MRSIKFLGLMLATLSLGACVNDDDTYLPDYTPVLFGEDFTFDSALEDTPVTIDGWLNVPTAGTKQWTYGYYSGTNYAEFNPYQSGNASNIGWLITPSINLDAQENEKLLFTVAQGYVNNSSNSFQVFYSSDFDGTNVASATWVPLALNNPPVLDYDYNFVYYPQEIDLSAITGNVHIGFRVIGSGTDTSIDGSYQLDNVRITN